MALYRGCSISAKDEVVVLWQPPVIPVLAKSLRSGQECVDGLIICLKRG